MNAGDIAYLGLGGGGVAVRYRILGLIGIIFGGWRTLAMVGGARPIGTDSGVRMAWWVGTVLCALMFLAGCYLLARGNGFPTRKGKPVKPSVRTPI